MAEIIAEENVNGAIESQGFDAQLLEAVRRQIEYYFSKENLANDKYLSSQMDAQMSVPIATVMKFAKLKALTQDEAVVKAALVDSSVTVVEDRLKANLKSVGRSTIILRELPTDSTEEEVREIFNYPGCKNIVSLRSDIGDTWFVVMDTEEDAKDTIIALRVNKRLFRGHPLKARLKTEAVVRSYFPTNVPTVPTPIFPIMQPFPILPTPGMDVLMPYYVPHYNGELGGPVPPEGAEGAATEGVQPAEGIAVEGGAGGRRGYGREHGKGNGGKSGASKGERPPRRTNSAGEGNGNRRNNREGGNREKKTNNAATTTSSSSTEEVPAIEVNAVTFPPLGNSNSPTAADKPIPVAGYTEPFQRYSVDEIIAIVRGIKDARLPEGISPEAHLVAMTPEINQDLLKRQRTFTIDETREQLRLGRPVMRDAILPGAVDYRSMMFGDCATPSGPAPTQRPSGETAVPAKNGSSASSEPVAAAETVQKAAEIPEVAVEDIHAAITSPGRTISAATWAAMVRSSANTVPSTSAENFPPPAPTGSSATSPPPAATQPVKTKSPSKGSGKSRENKNHRREAANAQPVEQATSTTETSNNVHSDAVPAVGNEQNNQENGANNADQTVEGAAWGGKASFANVLKAAGEAEPPVPTTKPVSTTKPRSSSHSSGTGKSNGKKGSGMDGDVWAKETLPALPAEK
eukprot:gene8564-9437_t